jgi:hypothetical protein
VLQRNRSLIVFLHFAGETKEVSGEKEGGLKAGDLLRLLSATCPVPLSPSPPAAVAGQSFRGSKPVDNVLVQRASVRVASKTFATFATPNPGFDRSLQAATRASACPSPTRMRRLL